MQMARLSPLDDDEIPMEPEEFQAGYDARTAGEPYCLSATRSWRAGWCDADCCIASGNVYLDAARPKKPANVRPN